MKNLQRPVGTHLPPRLRPLFWDHDFARLSWDTDRDLIVGRVLAAGDWEAVKWLIRRLSKPVMREWLVRRRGAGLSGRQLRFWELILKLPHRQVNDLLADPGRQVWEER